MKKVGYFLGICLAFAAGAAMERHICKKVIKGLRTEKDKFWCLFSILEQWVSNQQNKKRISDYLEKKGYQHVAIYGMSVLGNLLYSELKKNNQVAVDYAIDKNAADMFFDVKVIGPDKEFPETDIIIVTAVIEYEQIQKAIRRKSNADVISLEEVIFNIGEM